MRAAPMPAYRLRWENELLACPSLLPTMAEVVGGPFHVVHPETFAANLAAIDGVFDELGVDGLIRYGSKANKASAFLSECASAAEQVGDSRRIGVDVASEWEFRAALGAGVRGDEIIVTGPLPSPHSLRLARRHGSIVAVDSLASLRVLAERPAAARLEILLRLRPDSGTSRFGHTCHEISTALGVLDGAGHLRLRGFGFHLSGYAVAPRAHMGHRALDWCAEARARGHDATIISLGGGLPVSYVHESHWQGFRSGQDGTWYVDGAVPRELYPYACARPGPDALFDVLTSAVPDRDPSVAERAVAQGISVMVEPGRALCAGAGISVFPVRNVVNLPGEAATITVDGTSLSVSEQWFDSEYLPDPSLYPLLPHDDSGFGAAIAGGTCLDGDLLSRRFVPLPRSPEPGDLIVYPNTAGYQMDSNESEFHRIPVPPKIVLRGSDAGLMKWSLDR